MQKIFFLLPAFFVTGCLSMSQREKSEHIAKVPSLERSIKQGLSSLTLSEGNWPSDHWWDMFQSPILDGWICDAFAENPSLQASLARITAAKQHSLSVKSKLFPFLFFDATDNMAYFSKNGLDHLYNPSLPLHGYEVDLSLSFQYEVDFWSKNRNLFRAALGEMKAQEAEWAQARLIVSTSLAQSYFALSITQRRCELYTRLCAIKQQKWELQQDLYQSALSSLLDPLLLQEELQEARILLDGVQDEIATQKHQINILRGKGPDEPIAMEEGPFLPPKVAIPTNLSLDLLSRRPDLAAHIWKVEAIACQVSAAKADFFPSVNIIALAGLQSVSFSNLFSLSSKTASVEPAIHLPIFTGGELTARLQEQKALFTEAVFAYNSLILEAAQEVADLISHLHRVQSQKIKQEASVAEATKRLHLTQGNQAGGLVSTFAVLDKEEEVILQSLKDLDLLYTQYAFHIGLIRALGGGYQTTIPIGPTS